jgi:hypothetical protein
MMATPSFPQGKRPSIRAAITWGVVVGALQAASPLGPLVAGYSDRSPLHDSIPGYVAQPAETLSQPPKPFGSPTIQPELRLITARTT